MMQQLNVTVHSVLSDGPPDMDALTGRVAFIFDGCIVTGWPLGERHGQNDDGTPVWEADSDVGHGRVFYGVTHWVEFPVALWDLQEKPDAAPVIAQALAAAAPAAPALESRERGLEGLLPILDELDRATKKFPTWPTDPLHAVSVLGEEYGELVKAVLQAVYEPHKSTSEDVRTEALQVAAMALRFFMSLVRYQYQPGEQHSQQRED